MSKFRILFIITGSIAAYKAVYLLSRLTQAGHLIDCVLTRGALNFIGLNTIEGITGRKAHVDMYEAGQSMQHIYLVRSADLVIVAPATAHSINKMFHGISDDLATNLFLAHDFSKPWIIAPAMNSKMYSHPTTQNSMKGLKEMGVSILDSGSGVLACGEVGYGKLLEPDLIYSFLEQEFNKLAQKKVPTAAENLEIVPKVNESKNRTIRRILITGGGTVEPIDDVRAITNVSTGATAIELAHYLTECGYSVTLLINTTIPIMDDSGITVVKFRTFKDLNLKLKEILASAFFNYVIHAAAISDFHLHTINGKKPRSGKISSGSTLRLELKPNIKLISQIKKYSQNKQIEIIGFKLTSKIKSKEIKNKVSQLFKNPGVKLVVHNDMDTIRKTSARAHRFSIYNDSLEVIQSCESTNELAGCLTERFLKPPQGVI